MARICAALLAIVLLAAGCGDDAGSSSADDGEDTAFSETPEAPDSTESDTTEPAPESDSTESAPESDSTEPTVSGVEPAAVTPEYVCSLLNFDAGDHLHFFGYTNDGPDPVAVEPGDGNNLTSPGFGEANVPVVFASGEVFPAFFTHTQDESVPVWSLTTPDGTTRVTTGESAVDCAEEQMSRIESDDRDPRMEFNWERIGPSSVVITADVVDLPELSVCPAGLQPELVEVELSVESGSRDENETWDFSTEAAAKTLSVEVELSQVDMESQDGSGDNLLEIPTISRAFGRFTASITDICSFDGQQTRSWAMSQFFGNDDFFYGYDACVDAPGEPSAEPLELIVSRPGLRAARCIWLKRFGEILAVDGSNAGGGGMRIR